ncbi:MAG: hypothetical protein ABI763_09435 [Bacteroidota bacterium]
MRKLLPVLFLLLSVQCYSQDDGPYMGQKKTHIDTSKVDISGRRPNDASGGASDDMIRFSRTLSTGLVFNIAGTIVMGGAFVLKPQTIHQANTYRALLIAGSGLNLIGFIIDISAIGNMNAAAYKLRDKKVSLLMNENGIGLSLAIGK